MSKICLAKINWLLKEQNGRQTGLPFGDKYAPMMKQVKPVLMPVPWLDRNGAWSLLVKNVEFISENETIAEIQYLSELAPNNLDKDIEFELYEGNKIVATGKVL